MNFITVLIFMSARGQHYQARTRPTRRGAQYVYKPEQKVTTDVPPPAENQENNESNRTIGKYILGKRIGKGTFGKVKIGTHIITGEKVAVKILEKSKIVDASDIERVRREIKIFKKTYHPYVTQLYEIIDTAHHIYLIMEYADSGELFDYIVNHGRINERDACRFFHQIVESLDYVHKLKVCHRDLKPENILLEKNKDFYTVKLIDFGLSNTYEGDILLKTACGSPCYAAPEMIAGKRYSGSCVDIWSLGVVLFAMVCGYLPFEDDNTAVLYRKILSGQYQTPNYLSHEVKDLLHKILETDPNKRYTMNDIRKHKWYTQVISFVPQYPEDCVHHESIDENIINWMVDLELDKNKSIESVEKNLHNEYTASYYLLKKKIHREGLPANRKQLGVTKSTPYVIQKSKNEEKPKNEQENNKSDKTTTATNEAITLEPLQIQDLKNNKLFYRNNNNNNNGKDNEVENLIVINPIKNENENNDLPNVENNNTSKQQQQQQTVTTRPTSSPRGTTTANTQQQPIQPHRPIIPSLPVKQRPVSSMEYSPRLNPIIPTNAFLVPRPPPQSQQPTGPKPQSSQQAQRPIIGPSNREGAVSARDRMINTPNYGERYVSPYAQSARMNAGSVNNNKKVSSPRAIGVNGINLSSSPRSTSPKPPITSSSRPGTRNGRRIVELNEMNVNVKKSLSEVSIMCRKIIKELGINLQCETSDKLICDKMGITFEVNLKENSSSSTSVTIKKCVGDSWIFKQITSGIISQLNV